MANALYCRQQKYKELRRSNIDLINVLFHAGKVKEPLEGCLGSIIGNCLVSGVAAQREVDWLGRT